MFYKYHLLGNRTIFLTEITVRGFVDARFKERFVGKPVSQQLLLVAAVATL